MDEDNYELESGSYDDLADYEDHEDEEAGSDLDEMLAALPESVAEAKQRRRKSRGRGRGQPVRTAKGNNAFRRNPEGKYVTQEQLKSALGRVGADVRRNAMGIKSVNKRVGAVDRRVDDVVSVNRVQSTHIARLQQQQKLDAALEFAAAYDGSSLNAFQLLKGAVKSGMLGESKGALGNPVVVGLLGFVLNQPAVLGGILRGATGGTP